MLVAGPQGRTQAGDHFVAPRVLEQARAPLRCVTLAAIILNLSNCVERPQPLILPPLIRRCYLAWQGGYIMQHLDFVVVAAWIVLGAGGFMAVPKVGEQALI